MFPSEKKNSHEIMCRRYLHITSLHELSYFLVETYNGLQYYDDFISVNPLLYN